MITSGGNGHKIIKNDHLTLPLLFCCQVPQNKSYLSWSWFTISATQAAWKSQVWGGRILGNLSYDPLFAKLPTLPSTSQPNAMSNRQGLPYAFWLHENYCWNYPFFRWCLFSFLIRGKTPRWVNCTKQFPAQQNWTDDWNQNHCRLTKCPPNVSCAPSFPILTLTWQQQL